MSRKLPVFLVIDVSESVAGPLQSAMSSGIEAIADALRSDPQALETVHISIIVFAGRAKVLVPMIEIAQFHYPPSLPIGGGTSFAAALELLMGEIDAHVVAGNASRKADWKPIVFLMTDGRPTSDSRAMVERWQKDYASRARLIAVSVGGGADHRLLRQVSEDVVVLNDTSAESLGRFFSWMSQSVAVHSRAIESRAGAGPVDLSKALPEGAVSLEKSAEPSSNLDTIDDRFAILIGKCQKSEAPYLVRYERTGQAVLDTGADTRNTGQSLLGSTGRYELRQALPLSASYFELSENDGRTGVSIAASSLAGVPPCPQCGSRIGLVGCSCGGLHCIDGPGAAVCPWCGSENNYQQAPKGVDVDLSRGAG